MKGFKRLLIPVLVVLFSASSLAFAASAKVGEREFRSHCAGCHGLDGKGNGPFVEMLTKKPTSLTALAKKNNGVFPFQWVYDVIEGTSTLQAHGTRDMPIWGERYATEIIRQYGEFGTEHPETVRCRILALVFFLATMQER